MHLQRFCFVALCIGLLGAQTKPAAPAASASPAAAPPPGLEQALRERVRTFYAGYVDQKLRKSYDTVADESKDAFLAAPRVAYRNFEIQKIEFSGDYTAAVVTTLVQSAIPIFGVFPSATPDRSYWKDVDGQWYWYVPPPPPGEANLSPGERMMRAMLGMPAPGGGNAAAPVSAPAGSGSAAGSGPAPVAAVPPGMPMRMPAGMPAMMPGMMPGAMPGGFSGGSPGGLPSPGGQSKADAAKLIRLERDAVEFSVDKPGSAVVNLSNAGSGAIQFAVLLQPVAGLTISSASDSVAPGRSTAITINWAPPVSGSAAKKSAPPASVLARISVFPTGLMLPLSIQFR
jgi:hypothetical protein